jgi:hypothetical protein
MVRGFGFGAKINGLVSHCFPLVPGCVYLDGLEGLMGAYAAAVGALAFSGPTHFSGVLGETIRMIQADRKPDTYEVLLILTDGVIHDMERTIALIIEACALPLSVIIVGIGEEDFGSMEKLDGDSMLMGKDGRKAPRDIVQFVPFRKVKNHKELLREHVLREVPAQCEGFFRMYNLPPNPPRTA